MIKKILIVDDSPIAVKILKRCLPTEYEFESHVASNGAEGIALYKKVRPDLTFLDLTMPVMDGIQALDEIVRFDKDAIVIIVTADAQKKVYDKVTAKGAFMVLSKPPAREFVKAAILKAELAKEKLGVRS